MADLQFAAAWKYHVILSQSVPCGVCLVQCCSGVETYLAVGASSEFAIISGSTRTVGNDCIGIEPAWKDGSRKDSQKSNL